MKHHTLGAAGAVYRGVNEKPRRSDCLTDGDTSYVVERMLEVAAFLLLIDTIVMTDRKR